MLWYQKQIKLPPYSRGFHLVTQQILDEFKEIQTISIGLLNVFIQHTSASLTINENADPDVREDLEMAINRICPESTPFSHTVEGPDDMPAHVKCSLMGPSLNIPISDGALRFGTWQGIYLCEHRNRGGARKLIVTAHGIAHHD